MNYLRRVVSILGLLLISIAANAADWQLDNTQSKLSFMSIKKQNIAEVHTFGQLSGGLNAAGEFSLNIDLSSVDTNIDIRNDRMKEFLFEIADFPAANIKAKLDADSINAMTVGQQVSDSVTGTLALHGQQQELQFDVVISKLADDKLFVVSSKPVVLTVSDYQLVEGVEKLRELAGLPSISHAVPVSFYLSLDAAN